MNVTDTTVSLQLGDSPPKARLLYGQDVRASLRMLPEKSIHMACTSPPYWGLRSYGGEPSVWGGDESCEHLWMDTNCQKCSAWLGDLGLEPTPELFVQHLVEVFREVKRVLRDDAVLWVNLGDSYCSSSTSSRGSRPHLSGSNDLNPSVRNPVPVGMKPKDLVGIPWMVAFALRADGWYLRADIIWAKNNPMPESVTDRPTKAHEYVFLLTKNEKYFYDADAVREPSITGDNRRPYAPGQVDQRGDGHARGGGQERSSEAITRNKRSVWTINPKGYAGAHFAVWPEALVKPMILAGTSEQGCCSTPGCGAPYTRTVSKDQPDEPYEYLEVGIPGEGPSRGRRPGTMGNGLAVLGETWGPTCKCDPSLPKVRATVLDPFSGSATTGKVAMALGRDYIGIDLNQEYLPLAVARLEDRKAPVKDAGPIPEGSVEDLFG